MSRLLNGGKRDLGALLRWVLAAVEQSCRLLLALGRRFAFLRGGRLKLVLAACLLALLGAVQSPVSTNAGVAVVSIFVDGTERIVSTSATTVAEVVERAGIELNGADLIEPGLETVIDAPLFNINVYRAQSYVVIDGEETVTVNSAYRSPALIASRAAGFEVYPEDGYAVELIRDFVGTGSVGHKITIIRSLPVTLVTDGETLQLRTHRETVAGLLEEAGVVAGEEDIVTPDPASAIRAGQEITVVRVGYETENERVPIAADTRIVYDDSREIGWEEVREAGSDGTRLVTYRVVYHDDEEVEREQLQAVVLEEPVTRVVVRGNKRPVFSDPAGNRAIGYSMATSRGWGGEWTCLEQLWTRESHWNHLARNPTSGAYGIPQSLPANKMATHGSDWETNPRTQIAWGLDYIANRYGSPCGAWNFFLSNNWY